MGDLKIYNSFTRAKEKFTAIEPPHVGLYVCGPTVYSDVHLGNCRTFISFDLVYRYLSHLDYKVRYVRNITDAGHLENDADEGEDKISKKARLEHLEPMEIVQKYSLSFHNVLDRFNNIPPSIEPTATGHIVEQIDMIEEIITKGYGYEVNGSVYFDVEKYDKNIGYGKLSGRQLDEMISGTRSLDGQSEKRNPLDFALWKKAGPQHIMQWNSPWSKGFPGWHLECSVMSSKYLGDNFDIHGGGMDLKFPHHECEIAQCHVAHGQNPVNYWMHGNMLTLNGAKMSKSTGNTLLPDELFEGNNEFFERGFEPFVVRFFIMQAHYRSTLDFSSDALEASDRGLQKLVSAYDNLTSIKAVESSDVDVKTLQKKCYDAMNDDFNTPLTISYLFEAVKWINSSIAGKLSLTADDVVLIKKIIDDFLIDIMGVNFLSTDAKSDGESKESQLVELLIKLRKEAKENKNWGLADEIRNELSDMQILLKDSKEGTTWTKDS